MNLSLAALPNPMEELARLRTENSDLRHRLQVANDKAMEAEQEAKNAVRGVQELRTILSPLYQGLRRVFGEIEQISINGDGVSSHAGMDPRKAAVWEDWKRKMPGIPARFIDALMIHGELTQTQLRIHAKCAVGSVAGVVSQLYKGGLINKNGGRISLKEL